MIYPRMLGVLVIVSVMAALVLGMPVMADTNLPIGGQGQIVNTDGDGVRVRAEPSTAATTLKLLEESWRVTVLAGPVAGATGGHWYKIGHTGVTGYILSDFLTTATGATGGLVIGERAQVATDDGASLRLRDAPGGGVIMTMKDGSLLTVVAGPATDDTNQRWFQVEYQERQGWALGAYLRPAAEAAAQRDTTSRAGTRSEATPPDESRRASGGGTAIASLARKYVGSRYVWGGSTPAGFDCSGLVRYVVAEAVGIQLGRDVFAQVTAGQPIAPGDLQPGDLVFQKNTYRWGLSHVGIYIGDGRMISAQSESTGVRVESIWDSYWGPRFYSARRIVK